jgi:hypothetical protein
MVKYFTEDTVVPKELEHFVRPVKTDIMQGGISDKQQPILYERIPDITVYIKF